MMSRKDRKKAKGRATAKASKIESNPKAEPQPREDPQSPSPKSIETAHEIAGFKAEIVSLQGKLKASTIKVERLLENRTQLQHDLLAATAELNTTVVSESTADAKLIGFFAVWVTTGRPRFCSFPVIPTFGALGPEIDLKNQLNEDGDWQGFRLWQAGEAGEAIIFEPYDAADSG